MAQLIIDIGSYSTKYGTEDQETPNECRTCLYTPLFPSAIVASMSTLIQKAHKQQQKEQFLLTAEYRGLYKARELFLDNGRLEKVSDVCQLISFIFQQYKFQVQKLTLILPPLVTEFQQRQIQKYIFEQLNVDSLLISNGAIYALYCTGRTEGLVVSIGDTTSYALPVLNNLTTNIFITNRGGRMVSKLLVKQMYEVSNGSIGFDICAIGNVKYDTELAYAFKHQAGAVQSLQMKQIGQQDEENVSFCLLGDLQQQQSGKQPSETTEPTPHYYTISLARQRVFDAFEMLFDQFSSPEPTIVDIISQAVHSVPVNLQAKLLNNVLVTGGSAATEGVCIRIQEELKSVFPLLEPKVYQVKQGRFAHYHGAVACCQLNAFQGFYVSKNDV